MISPAATPACLRASMLEYIYQEALRTPGMSPADAISRN